VSVPVPASGSGSPPSGSSLTRRHAQTTNLFRKPLASSTVLVLWRSSSAVMCPITLMCASLARAGAVRVNSWSGRPSQAERNVGDKVEISRAVALSTLANSGSIASSLRSVAPGSVPVGSRTAQMSPSPLDRPVRIRLSIEGSAPVINRHTRSHELPFLALALSPTSTRNSFG